MRPGRSHARDRGAGSACAASRPTSRTGERGIGRSVVSVAPKSSRASTSTINFMPCQCAPAGVGQQEVDEEASGEGIGCTLRDHHGARQQEGVVRGRHHGEVRILRGPGKRIRAEHVVGDEISPARHAIDDLGRAAGCDRVRSPEGLDQRRRTSSPAASRERRRGSRPRTLRCRRSRPGLRNVAPPAAAGRAGRSAMPAPRPPAPASGCRRSPPARSSPRRVRRASWRCRGGPR